MENNYITNKKSNWGKWALGATLASLIGGAAYKYGESVGAA